MIFKMTMRTALFAILLSTAFGCKKRTPDNVVIPEPEQPVLDAGIYAVGSSAATVNSITKATIWKNGVPTTLADRESFAYAIAIKSKDI